jgi:malonate transporter
MSFLFETILFVFGLVALGYAAGKTNYLSSDTGDGLSDFAVNVAMPLLLFRTMVSADFNGSIPWSLWGAYAVAVAVAWTVGHLVTTQIFGRDSQAGVVGGVATSFSNLVLLGIPFIIGIYGQEGFEILSLIISVHLPTMMMASIILFEVFGRGNGGAVQIFRIFFRRLSTNPLIWGIILGLLWRLTGIEMPALPARLIDALAGIAAPVALFAMGLSLVKFDVRGNLRPAFALTVVKLMLMPAVALASAWAFDLSPLAAKIVVAAAALPSGVNSYLIATQFGTGQALASNQMTIATACAVVTTAFWLWLSVLIFG